jgi:dTDP-4-dehydrorhamnose reductase
MRILVFGKSGQVATELARQADVIALGRDEADLSDPRPAPRRSGRMRPRP